MLVLATRVFVHHTHGVYGRADKSPPKHTPTGDRTDDPAKQDSLAYQIATKAADLSGQC